MAEIAPFRGILYRPERADAPDVSALLAPPYDVISEAGRQALAQKSPHNAVHLILPKDQAGGDSDGKYGVAAATLQQLLAQGAMHRDEQPALYRYHQVFSPPGRSGPTASGSGGTITRRGFIARIRLHRFAEGVVLPHERTLAGPKLDRLKLKRATRTHLSQVFGLYNDPARATDAAFGELESQAPDLFGTTEDGVLHRLWRLTDPRAIAEVCRPLRDKQIYIADGHHRYETMLALRDEWRAEPGYRGNDSAAEYGSIFLCNVADPGLLVFPTHRVLHSLAGFDLPGLLGKLGRHFDIVETPLGSLEMAQAQLAEYGRRAPSFLLVSGGRALYLSVRPEAAATIAGPAVLRDLDVTVLHALVFESALGIDRAAQEAQTYLRYLKDFGQAVAAATSGDGTQAVFLLNPTRVEQVMAVAEAGEVMPQKSTYFYPKIASGIVLNPVDPAEAVDAV